MERGWHLAQINVGRLVAQPDDPCIASVVAALGRVNALADASPSFVWRLQDGKGEGALTLRPTSDPQFAVNMSVCTDDTTPSIEDGLARLWRLDRYGPTPWAVTFKARFPQPGLAGPPVDHRPDPWCVGSA